MADHIRVRLNPAGIRSVMGSERARADILRRAEAIRDACNEGSSWGGYEAAPEAENWRASANVWTITARDIEARDNRMIRNLGAGR